MHRLMKCEGSETLQPLNRQIFLLQLRPLLRQYQTYIFLVSNK